MAMLWNHCLLLRFLGLALISASATRACASVNLKLFQSSCNAELLSNDSMSGMKTLLLPLQSKGLGVVATHDLPRGTKIMVEEALLSVPMPEMVPGQGLRLADMLMNLEAAFQTLSPKQQQVFFELHDHRFLRDEDHSKLLTIVRSNAYNTGDDQVGIFPKIARINHSCKPNSGNFWSEKENHRVIYAFRDIEKGEEITVSYIPLLKSIQERHARLYQYGFTCDCSACQSSESSMRRVKIADTIEILEQKAHLQTMKEKTIEKMLDKATSLVDMIEQEELGDYRAKAYHLAAVFHEKKGDVVEAKKWAVKELDMHQLAELDSMEALTTIEYIDDLSMTEMMTLFPKEI
ncbi:SET domain-containing protein [Acephala macrosclerotiorum]|nr:SET domain-containing protein [Acephala macrosclerotiorum]